MSFLDTPKEPADKISVYLSLMLTDAKTSILYKTDEGLVILDIQERYLSAPSRHSTTNFFATFASSITSERGFSFLNLIVSSSQN